MTASPAPSTIKKTTAKTAITFAIILFILLDGAILGINYWITQQMYQDAIDINLSGRQRMLSQRITKVLLQESLNQNETQQTILDKELRLSARLFFTTLTGFAQGGQVIGGDGSDIYIRAIEDPHAQSLIEQTASLTQPLLTLLTPYMNQTSAIPQSVLTSAKTFMVDNNLLILDQMNQLTFTLEKASQQRTELLRLVQTIIFIIALINFFIIIRSIRLQTDQATQLSQHFNTLAMHDPLTGLFNRRYFTEKLTAHIKEASYVNTSENQFALLMLDLDGFKPVNDTYGHEAGDIVLTVVANRLKGNMRQPDTIARLGGDEFAIICPHIHNIEEATKVAQRLLSAICEPIGIMQYDVTVGVSIGVAFYNTQRISSIKHLLEMTDAAMYQAKEQGRGRFVFADNLDVEIQTPKS